MILWRDLDWALTLYRAEQKKKGQCVGREVVKPVCL